MFGRPDVGQRGKEKRKRKSVAKIENIRREIKHVEQHEELSLSNFWKREEIGPVKVIQKIVRQRSIALFVCLRFAECQRPALDCQIQVSPRVSHHII